MSKSYQKITLNQYILYNPRRDDWHEHFMWDGEYIQGLTATGRATVASLNLNRVLALAIRREELALGRHPAF
jgi:hypothetical protein